jgi:transposase InsO family protein
VRDLASGEQLAAVPTDGQCADDVVRVLWALFLLHGPPLVLKHDNGSGFIAEVVQLLLACYGVLWLRSPAYYPRYNGSCEAGVGSLSRRTERLAAADGRPAWWTSDDLERARLEANATALPHGPRGPTPDEAWQARTPIESPERDTLLAAYRQQLGERLRAWETREGGSPTERDRASIERQAIAGALADQNLLTYRRRPITPHDHPG